MSPKNEFLEDEDFEVPAKPKKKVILDDDDEPKVKITVKKVAEEPVKKVKSVLDDIEDDDTKPVKKAVKNYKASTEATRRILGNITDNDKWWKPKPGSNPIRILPGLDGASWIYPSTLHYGFVVEEKNRAFPCLHEMIIEGEKAKKPCPVCQAIAYFNREADPDVEKIMKKIKPRWNYLMNIIDRKDPHPTARIYSSTPPVAKIIKRFLNDNDDIEDITDPVHGRDIVITKEGEGLATEYSASVKLKESPLDVEDWDENMWDLEENAYREIPSYRQYCQHMVDSFGEIIPDIHKAFIVPGKVVKKVKTEEID